MGLLRLVLRLFRRPARPVVVRTPPQFAERQAARRQAPQVVLVEVPPPPPPPEVVLRGRCWVIDGDTIDIDGTRLRLAGIDAPELDHPFGNQAKWAMVKLCKGQVITARILPELSYDRVVAQCFLPDGRDLAAELVRAGLALDWSKFSGGKYRHLEAPDARRRLWRADARQKGRLPPPAQ